MKKKIPFDLERAKAGEPFYFENARFKRIFRGISEKGYVLYDAYNETGWLFVDKMRIEEIKSFNAYHLIEVPERWLVIDIHEKIYSNKDDAESFVNKYGPYVYKAVRLHDENIEP